MPKSSQGESVFEGFASPSFTQVPDELFDVLMPSLADAELRVLLYIIRRTFGFKRDSDSISLSQMVSGITTRDGRVLDHGTGLSKATVARGLKGLRDQGIIVAERHSSLERGHEPTSYRLRFKVDAPASPFPLSHSQDKDHSAPHVSPARQAMSHPRDTQHTGNKTTDFDLSKGNSLAAVDDERQKSPPQRPDNFEQASMASDTPLKDLLAKRAHKRSGAGGEDRAAIGSVIERFADELGDSAPIVSSTSRAMNLFAASTASRAGFIDLMFAAKGEVQDRYRYPGKAPLPRNRMAYFFSVVEDRLGVTRGAA